MIFNCSTGRLFLGILKNTLSTARHLSYNRASSKIASVIVTTFGSLDTTGPGGRVVDSRTIAIS
jgi:hypothetical protein